MLSLAIVVMHNAKTPRDISSDTIAIGLAAIWRSSLGKPIAMNNPTMQLRMIEPTVDAFPPLRTKRANNKSNPPATSNVAEPAVAASRIS